MAYYRTCPNCGAALDPGERCDCEDIKNAAHDGANITDSTQKTYSDNSFYHVRKNTVNRKPA